MVTRCLFRSLRGKVQKKVKGKRAPYPWGGKGGSGTFGGWGKGCKKGGAALWGMLIIMDSVKNDDFPKFSPCEHLYEKGAKGGTISEH